MNFEEKINENIKVAMKEQKEGTLRTLRAIKSAIIIFKTSGDYKGTISEQDAIKMVQKLVKQRNDSIAIFEQQNRIDLLKKEKEEVEVLNSFLPKQLNTEELTAIINELIIENNITKDPKEMGKLIGLTNQKIKGQADGKTISTLVQKILNA